MLGWLDRLSAGAALADGKPGPDQAVHALLGWEREAIIALLRRLAHHRPVVSQAGASRLRRGARARLGIDVLARVDAEGLILPKPAREPVAKKTVAGLGTVCPTVWAHDFTHFPRARRVTIAVLDLVSRYWIATLVPCLTLGATTGDIRGFEVGTTDAEGELRAERAGRGQGRIYTLAYIAEDKAGNGDSCQTTVTARHDRGRR